MNAEAKPPRDADSIRRITDAAGDSAFLTLIAQITAAVEDHEGRTRRLRAAYRARAKKPEESPRETP
jgi:hypothetical protein